MTGGRVERRLVAVLAADVAGYSRLMGADELGTLAALKTVRRDVVDPAISEHKGRIVKTTGDGMLVEFASAVDAVSCAVKLQEKMAERTAERTEPHIQFRVGINVGDIIIDADDIFGDGVNVTARVENECEPGGVYLSEDAYRQVRGKTPFAFDNLGERSLKNIDRPVRLYAVRSALFSTDTPAETAKPLPLPDKPSIAVLPFQNMSGDPDQEYFADGMVEDIIAALSRFKSLFVIARNSSFTYKGKAADIRQVGRELGVRYVLEGSVRKAGNRVRITGQLIDSQTGAHLWADQCDGVLEDIFSLQDQVTARVVGQLFSRVQFAEEERAVRKPTASLDAYDYHLRGMANLWKWTRDGNEAALSLFSKAIELDEGFALAHAFAGHIYVLRKQSRWTKNVVEEREISVRHSRRAIELDREDALALTLAGFNLAFMADELDLGAECIERALSMNSNLALGWHFGGWVNVYLGKHSAAVEHLARAERLSPRDPMLMQNNMATALALFFGGKFAEAARLTERITSALPTFLPAWRVGAISYAMNGDQDRAVIAARKVLEFDPAARVSILVPLLPLRRPEDRERYREGLRAAGIPD